MLLRAFPQQIEIGVLLTALLRSIGKEQLGWFGVEIEVLSVQCDQLTYSKPGISKQYDDRHYVLEGSLESISQVGVPN